LALLFHPTQLDLMVFSQTLVAFLLLAGVAFAAEPSGGSSAWREKVESATKQDPATLVGAVFAASKVSPHEASEILGAALSGVPEYPVDRVMDVVGAAIDGVTAARLDASQTLEWYDAVFAKANEFVPHYDRMPQQDGATGSKAVLTRGSTKGPSSGSKGGLPSRTGAKGGLPKDDGGPSMKEALSQLAADTYSRLESRMLAARLLSPWDVDRFGGTLPNSGNTGGGAGIGGSGNVSPFTP
jgi:hypothetical protein